MHKVVLLIFAKILEHKFINPILHKTNLVTDLRSDPLKIFHSNLAQVLEIFHSYAFLHFLFLTQDSGIISVTKKSEQA